MNKLRSIKQNELPDALPNFRNLGIILRTLLLTNLLAIFQAMMLAEDWLDVQLHIEQILMLLTPVLLATLLLLAGLQSWLQRLTYWRGVLSVCALAATVTLSFQALGSGLYHRVDAEAYYFDALRYVLLSLLVCAILLMYFRLRARVLSHALHDARLQVLRARIRPHFLFNTINAVLGIVRTRPAEAENALQDMADLFRMAMSNAQDLVPLRREIQLSRQYIALEQLRMGERLRVDWQIRDIPDDAMVPPLMLQPLLENAVYHGIEPLPRGGVINVALSRNVDGIQLVVENPCLPRDVAVEHGGNRMAMQNIRERLDLLFDAEARYRAGCDMDCYRVEISLPYSREKELGQN